ncbi:MAG: hypothetical protein KC503_27925, partial [Myxococcales bacterium]|nr:hypothetical protein [Myxococcales bacterium]
PHYDWSGLVRLPIFWEDDVHAVFFDGAFDGAASARAVLALERAELKVLNFHPVHIYLNTSDFDGYQHAKEVLRDEQQARALRRPESGVRTFFEQALAATRDLPRQKLGEVADAFRRDNAYVGAYARTLESP